MPRNPFWDHSEDKLLGERVRVRTGDGVFEGIASYFNHNETAVLLRDATGPDGEHHDTLMIRRDFELTLPAERVSHEVETVSLALVEQNPYSVRELDTPDFYHFVRQVRRNGGVRKLPEVRWVDRPDSDTKYQVVSGNKRIAALKAADIDSHPVEVCNLDPWDGAIRFIDEHFPLTAQEQNEAQNDSTSGWYGPRQMQAAYQRLCDMFDTDRVDSHPAIEANQAILAADEESADEVAAFLTENGQSALGEQAQSDSNGDGDAEQTLDSVAAALADETDVDEEKARDDLTVLREYSVPLGAAKGALRRKYR